MKRIFFFLIWTTFFVSSVCAQTDVAFTHFWMMEPQFNPAAVGIRPNLRVMGCYSNQMSGYTDNPKTMFLGADTPFHPNHAVGMYFLNDEIGAFSHKRVAVEYAYRFRLCGGLLSLGVQGEILNEGLDGGKLDVEDTSDPAIPSGTVNGNRIDGAAGIYYSHPLFYIGVSSLHLTSPTVTMGEKNQVDVKRSYYFTAGYNIALSNPLYTIHPCARWMYDGVSDRTDLSIRAQCANEKQRLFAGVSYSPSVSAALFVGGMFHGVVLSYSYEAYTGGVGLGNGAHELTLSYEIDINLAKKGKNRHQSVRLL